MITHIKNYISLARFDKPAGTLLLMWPCLMGVLVGCPLIFYEFVFKWAAIPNNNIPTFTAYYSMILLDFLTFAIGAFVMRSAGCIINDIWDRKIDAQVERTKNRPLASGKISLLGALIFLAILLFIGLYIFLSLGLYAKITALIGFVMAIFYPAMKRITNYPQAFLGLTFNIGFLVGYFQILDSENLPKTLYNLGSLYYIIPLPFYFALALWTIFYDTIYAFQDKNDDEKIGVKSTAISFNKETKNILVRLASISFMLIICTYYLAILPFHEYKYDYLYPVLCFLPAYFYMFYQVKKVDLSDKKSCAKYFNLSAYITGLLLFIGSLIFLNSHLESIFLGSYDEFECN
ncbi:MAG: 4-hydroxybenzoate octaprenyltransferase [Rickettsiales bacterium]|nr:4-hydroxybenzoate octaprenyltransferase [Rickettsiales bacterium]